MRPTCSSSSAADKDLESDFQIYVTLPVLGRGNVGKRRRCNKIGRVSLLGSCCARGRAHTANVAATVTAPLLPSARRVRTVPPAWGVWTFPAESVRGWGFFSQQSAPTQECPDSRRCGQDIRASETAPGCPDHSGLWPARGTTWAASTRQSRPGGFASRRLHRGPGLPAYPCRS